MRVQREISADRLSIVAAGVAFFSLLALFPALIALVSIYGLVSDPADVAEQMNSFYSVLPGDVAAIVGGQLSAIVSSASSELTLGFALSVGLALWTASSGIVTLIEGVAIAYDEPETRSFVKIRLLALGMTLGAIVVVVVMLAGIVVLPIWITGLGLGAVGEAIVTYGRWPVLALLFMGALSVVYRYGPDRQKPQWGWVTWGAVLATLLWLAGSLLFSLYTSNFADYNKTYGTLGAVVVLLMWLYVSAFIVLVGAEVNSEMEHQTARDTTDPPEKPIGERGAYVADTVGATAKELKGRAPEASADFGPKQGDNLTEERRRRRGDGRRRPTPRHPDEHR